jgi:23S rRNA (uracil1939-C5)-methyltransferase
VESKQDIWVGEIDRLGWGGLGLGRESDGRLVLLSAPLALFPGEMVQAALTRHPRHATGEVLEWQTADSRRVAPDCAVAWDCGGCALWGAGENAGELKRMMVADLLARQLPNAPDGWLWRPAPAGVQRHRIQLHWDGVALGYHARGSHRIVRVPGCPIAVPELQGALPLLAAALASGELPGGNARWELATGTPAQEIAATSSALPGTSWSLSPAGWRAPAAALQHSMAGITLRQTPGAFFQACAAWAIEAFYEIFREWELEGGTLFDLFGGSGLFSRILANRFYRFILVESSPLATADAQENLAGLNVEIFECPVEHWLTPGLGSPNDTIILDPPRAGLGRKLCKVLAQAQVGRIVLCGCDGAAFCRDVNLLAPRWRLHRLAVLDLFPNTPEVECIGELLPVS